MKHIFKLILWSVVASPFPAKTVVWKGSLIAK